MRITCRARVEDPTLPLTERLVSVFAGRLGQLDAAVRAELLRAALDGVNGSVGSSTRARHVMRNVTPAVTAGLLVVNPLGEIAFRHPLVRAAVIHQALSLIHISEPTRPY